jgi:hypothetical protein
MKLKDWNLPKGLNLDFLLDFISEKKLLEIIDKCADKPRKGRRVIFPSRSCLNKCNIYFLVQKFNGDYDAVLDILRGREKVMSAKGLYKGNIRKLYETRKREIAKEAKS